jgi:hypothetical protein
MRKDTYDVVGVLGQNLLLRSGRTGARELVRNGGQPLLRRRHLSRNIRIQEFDPTRTVLTENGI